jgi:polyisoprenoid-binding protein YceI
MAPTVTAAKTTWKIDPIHSNVEFAVKHLMISTVRGHFTDIVGSVATAEPDFADATLEVSIGVASIDTRNDDRNAHLRSADFFDAERYPTITFRSTGAERQSDGSVRLRGALTIHGVTHDVVLAVSPEGATRDPWGSQRAGFSATTKINRRDFGLTWNQALETGGFVVGDEVKISVDAELVRE